MHTDPFDFAGLGIEWLFSMVIHIVAACVVTPGLFFRGIGTSRAERGEAVFGATVCFILISATNAALIFAGSWWMQFAKLDRFLSLALAFLIFYDYLVSIALLIRCNRVPHASKAKGARPHASK